MTDNQLALALADRHAGQDANLAAGTTAHRDDRGRVEHAVHILAHAGRPFTADTGTSCPASWATGRDGTGSSKRPYAPPHPATAPAAPPVTAGGSAPHTRGPTVPEFVTVQQSHVGDRTATVIGETTKIPGLVIIPVLNLEHGYTGYWSVTHVVTGMAVVPCGLLESLDDAREFVGALAPSGLNWLGAIPGRDDREAWLRYRDAAAAALAEVVRSQGG